MAQYTVNTDTLRAGADSLRAAQQSLRSEAAKLALIQISRALNSRSSVVLMSRIADCNLAMMNQSLDLGRLARGLDSIASLYERNETNLSEPKTAIQAITEHLIDAISNITGGGDGDAENDNWTGNWPWLMKLSPVGVLGLLTGGGIPEEGSLFGGEVIGNGSLWGIPCSGQAGYGILGYEADGIAEAKWKPQDGEAKIQYGGELEGYIARGNASGNFGILGGSGEVSAGNAAVSGGIGLTLFDNGKFSPAIGAEVKAEASVLEGKGEVYLGDENNNVHVKGSGTVLGAEASAEAKIGVITTTDPATGETVTSYGVKGEAGAEAYLAEGKVSGGISIFGIDIDVGVSGKAGGAGVKAGGSVTTNGISGEVGVGLGLGGGVEISVDWSDFDPPSFEEIGDGLVEIGNDIGEGLEDAGNAIADFFGW